MFGTRVENGIDCPLGSTKVITPKNRTNRCEATYFQKKEFNPSNFLDVASANIRYSTSVLDPETTLCFREDQNIKLSPTNIAKTVVDLRSSTSLSQSESECTLFEARLNIKPWEAVDLT